MQKTLLLSLFCSLLALACTKTEGPVAPEDRPADGGAAEVVVATEFDAICGHVLAEVGHCGNYVKIDGKYVVLEHPSLGSMEFCGAGEEGARIKIAGAMVDGKYVATSYERVN